MKAQFLVVSKVKALAHASGKRVGADFLAALDGLVKEKIEKACALHNGSAKTLDAAVAGHVGAAAKGY